ncbi:cobalamin-independent methionine synthase [Pyrenophora tritici-repentis]|nr:cobalamin-independent methionine synthase [Pyrenophora tritici-repentis]KAI2485757.1 cobalamin-independent methionine synthase [Pyrenophora tritici-repentis]
MVHSSVLGFPRMGADRELKKANEAYWADKLSRDDLIKEGKRLRLEHWKIQKDAGVDVIPSNDFAFYDHLLDHIQLFNAIPERYSKHSLHKLDEYFAMGRGHQKEGVDVPSLVSRNSQAQQRAIANTHTGNGQVVRLKLPLRQAHLPGWPELPACREPQARC